jgi:putative amide transporter protein
VLGLVLLYVGAVLFVNGIWLMDKIRPREVAIMNIFTGLVGLVVAVFAVAEQDPDSIQLSAYVLLFAFTYLWVAYNQYIEAEGSGLGWYCLFVAITAVPVAIITLMGAVEVFDFWLGLNWAGWAVLWFIYFLLLALKMPIQRLAAWVTIVLGVITAWLPGFLALNGFI